MLYEPKTGARDVLGCFPSTVREGRKKDVGIFGGVRGGIVVGCRIGVKPLVCGRMWREEANNGLKLERRNRLRRGGKDNTRI
jgi:hypothetical protein